MTAIYLDNNATTAIDPVVREQMLPWLGERVGNPSSIHSFGLEARRAIDKARVSVARLVGAQPDEILFTGGGTEADNLAILGAAGASTRTGPRIATTAIEHQAVLKPCRYLAGTGCALTILPVGIDGLLNAGEADSALQEDTLLVSVMLANNDIGTIQPVGELSALLKKRGILLHTDAVQAAGKIPVDVTALGVDLLSLSAHKLHGPQGVGALYLRKGTRLSPRSYGGHQEKGLRPGTENVAAIVGFGKACEIARERLQADAARVETLRIFFENAVRERVEGVSINGRGAPRLPNTSNISFENIDGETLAINLDLLGVAVSTGAACSSSENEPSHVLVAMGQSQRQARSSVRFSFGRDNSREDAERAVELVVKAVESIRANR
ncbi:MAG TPA: cysteine desulfurase family protein [Acidobacteriota bacterium]|nr:cysteine desulfurase family protein [Acidobacteriota bacterium]